MRNESSGDERVQEPFELACAVGKVIVVPEDNLHYVTGGHYDVLSITTELFIENARATVMKRYVMRRVL